MVSSSNRQATLPRSSNLRLFRTQKVNPSPHPAKVFHARPPSQAQIPRQTPFHGTGQNLRYQVGQVVGVFLNTASPAAVKLTEQVRGVQ